MILADTWPIQRKRVQNWLCEGQCSSYWLIVLFFWNIHPIEVGKWLVPQKVPQKICNHLWLGAQKFRDHLWLGVQKFCDHLWSDWCHRNSASLTSATEILRPSLTSATEILRPSLTGAAEILQLALTGGAEILWPSLTGAAEILQLPLTGAAEILWPSPVRESKKFYSHQCLIFFFN